MPDFFPDKTSYTDGKSPWFNIHFMDQTETDACKSTFTKKAFSSTINVDHDAILKEKELVSDQSDLFSTSNQKCPITSCELVSDDGSSLQYVKLEVQDDKTCPGFTVGGKACKNCAVGIPGTCTLCGDSGLCC